MSRAGYHVLLLCLTHCSGEILRCPPPLSFPEDGVTIAYSLAPAYKVAQVLTQPELTGGVLVKIEFFCRAISSHIIYRLPIYRLPIYHTYQSEL